MLEKEFQYYLDNQDELVKKYNHRFLVIKGCNVLGDYESYEKALFESSKNNELGTFLIQKCTDGDAAYTQRYNSRVSFSKKLAQNEKKVARYEKICIYLSCLTILMRRCTLLGALSI